MKRRRSRWDNSDNALGQDLFDQESLGAEVLPNNLFLNWSGTYPNESPDNWTVAGNDVDNYVYEVDGGGAGIYSENTSTVYISRDTNINVGAIYLLTINFEVITNGWRLLVQDSTGEDYFVLDNGTDSQVQFAFIAIGNGILQTRFYRYLGAESEYIIKNISVKEISSPLKGYYSWPYSAGTEKITDQNDRDFSTEPDPTTGDETGSDLVDQEDLDSDVVVNGDFATDTVWSKGLGWTIGSGVATWTYGSGNGALRQSNILIYGLVYKITYEVTANTTDASLAVYTETSFKAVPIQEAVGTHEFYFIHDGSTVGTLTLSMSGGTTGAISIDNVVVEAVGVGPELVTNGDMELDSEWVDRNTPSTNERSSEQAHSGTYSRKFIAASQYDGIESGVNITTTSGTLYKFTMWVYGDASGDELYSRFSSGVTQVFLTQTAFSAGWFQYSMLFTSATSGTSKIEIYNASASPTGTFYIDDVSIREVKSVNKGIPETSATLALLGSMERISDGSFDKNSEYWTAGGGWTISGNEATQDGTLNTNLQQEITVTEGKMYSVRVNITAYTSGSVRLNNTSGCFQGVNVSMDSAGVHYVNVLATDDDEDFKLIAVSFIGTVDDISVREIGHSWIPLGDNYTLMEYDGIKTYCDDNAGGSQVYLRDGADLSENLVVGQWYEVTFNAKVSAGATINARIYDGSSNVDSANIAESFTAYSMVFQANTTNTCYLRFNGMANGERVWVNSITVKKIFAPPGNWIKSASGDGIYGVSQVSLGYSGNHSGNEQAVMISDGDTYLGMSLSQAYWSVTASRLHRFEARVAVPSGNTQKNVQIFEYGFEAEANKQIATIDLTGSEEEWVIISGYFYVYADVTGSVLVGFDGEPSDGDILYVDDITVRPVQSHWRPTTGSTNLVEIDEDDANEGMHCTYVDLSSGMRVNFSDSEDLSTDLVVGETYKITYEAKAVGSVRSRFWIGVQFSDEQVLTTSWAEYEITIVTGSATGLSMSFTGMAASEEVWIQNLKIQHLSTTDKENQVRWDKYRWKKLIT